MIPKKDDYGAQPPSAARINTPVAETLFTTSPLRYRSDVLRVKAATGAKAQVN